MFLLALMFPTIFIVVLMLMAYDDGKPFALFRRIKCKMGKHTTKVGFGFSKINKYYCQHCREPRKHPVLKVIEGGNKIGRNDFKF
jgi:hypothetical protein